MRIKQVKHQNKLGHINTNHITGENGLTTHGFRIRSDVKASAWSSLIRARNDCHHGVNPETGKCY